MEMITNMAATMIGKTRQVILGQSDTQATVESLSSVIGGREVFSIT